MQKLPIVRVLETICWENSSDWCAFSANESIFISQLYSYKYMCVCLLVWAVQYLLNVVKTISIQFKIITFT